MNLTKWLCSKSWNVRNTEIMYEAYRRWHKEDTSQFTEKYGVGMQKARDGSMQPLAWFAWVDHIQAEHNGEIE
tara:strand:- start:346 stop:564 length:219 start_codon:yes stop_codon:yes gene_type:complete